MDVTDLLAREELALKDAITREVQESLTLDFKLANEGNAVFRENGTLTTEGRRVVAKAISGFSNSDGGLIVFGVECKKINGLDCASRLAPLDNYERAKSNLNSEVGELLRPKNAGINVYSFPSQKYPDKGYVVIEVPRSDRRPHRSEASDQKGYFKRSGSSTFEMEHYDIEDAFRRKTAPEIALEIGCYKRSTAGDLHLIRMIFYIRNVGYVSAEAPQLELTELQGKRYQWPRDLSELSKGVHMEVASPKSIKYYSDTSFVLHPTDIRPFGVAEFEVLVNADGSIRSAAVGKELPFEIPLPFILRAKDMRALKGFFNFKTINVKDKPWETGVRIRQSNVD